MFGALATAVVDGPEGSAVEELPPLSEHEVNVSTADASKSRCQTHAGWTVRTLPKFPAAGEHLTIVAHVPAARRYLASRIVERITTAAKRGRPRADPWHKCRYATIANLGHRSLSGPNGRKRRSRGWPRAISAYSEQLNLPTEQPRWRAAKVFLLQASCRYRLCEASQSLVAERGDGGCDGHDW